MFGYDSDAKIQIIHIPFPDKEKKKADSLSVYIQAMCANEGGDHCRKRFIRTAAFSQHPPDIRRGIRIQRSGDQPDIRLWMTPQHRSRFGGKGISFPGIHVYGMIAKNLFVTTPQVETNQAVRPHDQRKVHLRL